MSKKLTVLAMSLAALAAFVLPATASASPQLRENGNPLISGAAITTTSHNTKVTNTPFGTLTCETWRFLSTVETNSGSVVKAKGTSGSTAVCFTDPDGIPFTVTKLAMTSLFTNGGDEGTTGVTFIVDIGPFECHYSGTGKFEYSTSSDVFEVPGIVLTPAEEFCHPEEGETPIFEGDYTVTTNNGPTTPVTIN